MTADLAQRGERYVDRYSLHLRSAGSAASQEPTPLTICSRSQSSQSSRLMHRISDRLTAAATALVVTGSGGNRWSVRCHGVAGGERRRPVVSIGVPPNLS